MLFIQTNHGFISSNFIVRMERQSEGAGWIVYYKAGTDERAAVADQNAATWFFAAHNKLSGQGIVA